MTAYPRNLPVDPVKLERLAEVAIKVGLRLREGQDLLVTAPAVALPLVRKVAEYAYKAGAGIVTPILSDETVTLARHRFGRTTRRGDFCRLPRRSRGCARGMGSA